MTPFNPASIDFAWLPILPLIAVTVGAIAVPVWASWACAAVLAFLAIMLLVEKHR